MAPPALFTMILNCTRPLAVRTFNLMIGWPLNIDLNKLLIDVQTDIGYKPRRHKAEQKTVVILQIGWWCFHPKIKAQ
jgi:hypothetical protein